MAQSSNITDVKVGNIVVCFDEYATGYDEHLFKVNSIEKDEEYATEDNPEGVVLYGIDLDCYDEETQEMENDDYIGVVHSGNFVSIAEN